MFFVINKKMKTKILVIFTLTFFLFSFKQIENKKNIKINPKENKITGTYLGLNDNFEFQFKTEDGKIVTFQEITDNVSVDLFDESFVGKKFEVFWIELTENITDDEGEPTGEKSFVKRITSVKQI